MEIVIGSGTLKIADIKHELFYFNFRTLKSAHMQRITRFTLTCKLRIIPD